MALPQGRRHHIDASLRYFKNANKSSSKCTIVLAADIALLKLYQPVALSPRISPACLPELSRPEPEESCIITGWGNSG